MRAANSQRFARAAAEGILVAKRQRAAASEPDFAILPRKEIYTRYPLISAQILFFLYFLGDFCLFLHLLEERFDTSRAISD